MSNNDEEVPVDDPIADAMRSVLSRSAADAPATGDWTNAVSRAGRVVRVRRLVVAAVCVVVLGIGAGVVATRSGGDGGGVRVENSATTTTITKQPLDLATAGDAARRQAGLDFANQMLGEAILPRRAQRSNAPPPPVLSTGSGGFGSAYDTDLAVHELWTMPQASKAVAAFAATHRPTGYTLSGNGSGTEDGVASLIVYQTKSELPPVIAAAELTWKITDAPGGGTLVRVDAVVMWIPRLPPEMPRRPALLATHAQGCPASIAQYNDIDNVKASRGPLLLPALAPSGALLCSYQDPAHLGVLTAQRVLDAGHADTLADAIRNMNLKPDVGLHSCPPGNGTTGILMFSFPGHADAALWWNASGCQYLDNGYATSAEAGNPSFYSDFLGAIHASRG